MAKKANRKKLKKEADQTMLDLYRQGLSYPEIAGCIGMTAGGVQARIRTLKQNIKKEEPILTFEELQTLRNRIRQLREEGKEMWAISRAIGITKPQVYRHLQALGLV